jgi:membrane-bound lytic murein transglycosylase D
MPLRAQLCAAGTAAVLLLIGTACSSSARVTPVAAPVVSPESMAMSRAEADFELGRQAALSGDFPCAQFFFARALEAVRPEGGLPPTKPELVSFSAELWEGILRYEALSAPPEDTAGAGEEHIAPELKRIEVAVEATEEAISEAANAVASDSAGISYDIPIVVNEGVLKIVATFQHDLHDIIARGLARSGRYVPMIHRVFAEEGIPKDLAQVALIESSFLPRAHSPKTAHGIWQFMPRTGRQYGLASNAVLDERSDPEKATRAAAKHLVYLHDLFHDWYLALAAYNAGEGRILRAMEKTGLTDFWQLAASGILKAQTVNYVPAVIAATLISKNPAHYGFDVEYEKPLEYETVLLDRPVRLSHLIVSERVTLEELQRLNPELRTEVTPKQGDGYSLKVPPGTRDVVEAAYADAPTARPPAFRRYVARHNDTLASIAKRFRMKAGDVAAANPSLSSSARLRKGQVVAIPLPEVVTVAGKHPGKKGKASAESGAARRPETSVAKAKHYRVRGGDTLFRIARQNGTTVERIMAANSLSSATEIRVGDLIRIPASH